MQLSLTSTTHFSSSFEVLKIFSSKEIWKTWLSPFWLSDFIPPYVTEELRVPLLVSSENSISSEGGMGSKDVKVKNSSLDYCLGCQLEVVNCFMLFFQFQSVEIMVGISMCSGTEGLGKSTLVS